MDESSSDNVAETPIQSQPKTSRGLHGPSLGIGSRDCHSFNNFSVFGNECNRY